MMQQTGIIEEIKATFKEGSMLTRLIYINLGIFVVVKVFDAIFFLFSIQEGSFLIEWLAVPADLGLLLYKPWTIITYMFLHQSFIHILFNMLWLFWFGKIFLEYLTGKQLLNVYLLGGISGALLYILAFNTLPAFAESVPYAIALGASASVLAIVVATAVYVPDYTMHLMFIGPVKLKYIALISVVMDIIFIMDGNAGGHIAHIGGAAFGYLYGSQYKNGVDIGKGFGKTLDNLFDMFKPKSKLKVSHKRSENDLDYNKRKNSEQKNVDAILEKIASSGYDSLNKKEKEILFKQSKNN